MNIKNTFLALGLLVPVLAGVGCTRHVSRGITSDGDASELVFPDESNMVVEGGTSPSLENLRPLAAGMTKDDMRALIGSPQFREGYGAREWDYLFQLTDLAGNAKRCRFKAIFDTQKVARNLYWAPAECAALVQGAAMTAPMAPTAQEAARDMPPMSSGPRASLNQFALSADALFGFGKWREGDLSVAGRQRLREIAAVLLQQADGIQQVQVVGYADRIGDAGANQRLSQRRAETVRGILVSAGLPAAGVIARGLGEGSPFTQCSESLAGAALVACLAPDRRVEIIARPAS